MIGFSFIFGRSPLHIPQLKINPYLANFGVFTVQSKPPQTPHFASILKEGVSRASFSHDLKLFSKIWQIEC
tara:strand:+ start:1061 stop:1273 length:213 start_codon:yes stop_codon:yes gene_type:complete